MHATYTLSSTKTLCIVCTRQRFILLLCSRIRVFVLYKYIVKFYVLEYVERSFLDA